MFAANRWSSLLASILALGVAAAHAGDDVFVQEGVIVKPLPKWKQRKLEKKLLRHPGNQVVIEGGPSTAPDVLAGARTRRAMRPLFGDLFNRRTDVVVAPPVVAAPSVVVTTPSTTIASPSAIVSVPRSSVAPGDPLVMPGSVEVESPAPIVRPPVISTPRRSPSPSVLPVEPIDEPDLDDDRPGSLRVLPPPADEIPPPVVSTPRKASASPNPNPVLEPTPPRPTLEPTPASPAPAMPIDPGPTPPVTPPVTEPVVEPTLELPNAPRPA